MNGPVEGASPLVSVVIPAYNEEAALPGCLVISIAGHGLTV